MANKTLTISIQGNMDVGQNLPKETDIKRNRTPTDRCKSINLLTNNKPMEKNQIHKS